MSTLDEPTTTFNEESVSPASVIQRYALIAGLAFIVFFLISQLTGLAEPGGGFLNGVISFVVSVGLYFGLSALAVRQHRDSDLEGFISFKRAFRVGFLVLFFGALISAAFSLLYVTVIDPGYYDGLLDNMIRQWEEQGLSEEQIDSALSFTEPMMSPWFTLIAGVVGGAIFSALVALVTGAIFKREAPQT